MFRINGLNHIINKACMFKNQERNQWEEGKHFTR